MSKTDLAVSPRQSVPKKYPPGGCGVAPCKQSPRIMIYYAPIAKAIRQSRTSPPGVPLPPFLRPSLPALTFPRSALTEQGAKTIAYNQSKNESKRNKQTRQKAKEKGKPIILYSTHIQKQEKRKASNNIQARQREKQERSPKSI